MPSFSDLRNADLLAVYCNDHIAAATGGIELVGRMLSAHKGGEYEGPLEQLLSELRDEKASLRAIMATLGFPLRIAAAADPRLPEEELNRLIDQANNQHEWLTRTRREVSMAIFGGSPEAADRTPDA